MQRDLHSMERVSERGIPGLRASAGTSARG
jgi:hypothetical protein